MTDTHTVTTDIDDDLRHALATAAQPDSVRVGGAAVAAGVIEAAIAGAEL